MATTRKLLALLLLLTLPAGGRAQPGPGKSFSKMQLDSLRQGLRTSRADTSRVNQLLLLGRCYLSRFMGAQHKADTVLLLARQAQALSQTLHYPKGQGVSYLVSAQAWLQKEDAAQEKQCAQQAVALFTRLGDTRRTAEAYWELSLGLGHSMEDVPAQIRCYDQCLTLYRKLGDVLAQANVLAERSNSNILAGKEDAALADLHAALQLYQSIGYAQLTAIYSQLGTAYVRREDYKTGLSYGLLAIKTVEAIGDTSIVAAQAYNQVGNVYASLADRNKTLAYYRKALGLVQHKPYDDVVIAVFTNTVGALEKAGQPAAALRLLTRFIKQYPPNEETRRILTSLQLLGLHTSLKQYALAQQDYNQLMVLVKSMPEDDIRLGLVYRKTIAFLLATRQYELARATLAQQERYYRHRQNNLQDIGRNQLGWFQLDSMLGNYPAAIQHYQRYIASKDSVFTQAKAKEISRLDVQYQSARKDQKIKLQKQNIQLLGKQKLLQGRHLQLQRNGAAAGAVLLLALLALGYNRYQLKQRGNQLLETKQAEINQQNQALAQVVQEKEALLVEKSGLLEEKEWMLKEIHHRVKNNLQVIKSLLNLQSDFLQDPAALHAMRESQNRVHAMALIHQKLYQSDTLARVNMREYVQDIADYLLHCFDQERTVRLRLEVADVELDVAVATPLGLLLNEAVTNSLKYAFPQHHRGTIAIALVPEAAPAGYRFTIADDGVGMPEGFYVEQVRTLGITMIQGLSKQLGAELTIVHDSGVQITLRFQAAGKPVRVAAAPV